jgi:putative hemolysin
LLIDHDEPGFTPKLFIPKRAETPEQTARLNPASTGLRCGKAGSPFELFSASSPHISLELGKFQLRLAETLAEREAACLRCTVFNLELGEGFASSWHTGLDRDRFDLFCEHLIVEHRSCSQVVGTYRMQSGVTASAHLGYYSEQEFDFTPYRRLRPQILELGRAAIDRRHRTSEVLMLRTYIAVGARICGEPAWDRDFGTIDVLTLLDLAQLSPAARNRFLPESAEAPVASGPVCVS